MEVGFKVYYFEVAEAFGRVCFNPCFSGSWFQSLSLLLLIAAYVTVLILVLVEVGFKEQKRNFLC